MYFLFKLHSVRPNVTGIHYHVSVAFSHWKQTFYTFNRPLVPHVTLDFASNPYDNASNNTNNSNNNTIMRAKFLTAWIKVQSQARLSLMVLSGCVTDVSLTRKMFVAKYCWLKKMQLMQCNKCSATCAVKMCSATWEVQHVQCHTWKQRKTCSARHAVKHVQCNMCSATHKRK